MNYYYIFSENLNPYWNLAMEQCLFSYVRDHTAILFLWQNEHTIVIGRNQNIYAECRVQAFLGDGGILARRRSGGGAVYHDRGNLNYSLICSASEDTGYPYQILLRNVLEGYGVQTEFNGRNDLTAGGRKFSGNAVYRDDRMICRHGTLLVCTDLDKMSAYLTPDVGKLARNHVQSVSARVINLHSLSEKITVSSICRTMIELLQAKCLVTGPQEDEIRKLAKVYAGADWVYGGVL